MKKPEIDMKSKPMMVDTKAYSEMIDALIESQNAMDNWVRTYASDQCDQETVDKAKAEIYNRGGTLAYIADVKKGIIEALKKAGCTE